MTKKERFGKVANQLREIVREIEDLGMPLTRDESEDSALACEQMTDAIKALDLAIRTCRRIENGL